MEEMNLDKIKTEPFPTENDKNFEYPIFFEIKKEEIEEEEIKKEEIEEEDIKKEEIEEEDIKKEEIEQLHSSIQIPDYEIKNELDEECNGDNEYWLQQSISSPGDSSKTGNPIKVEDIKATNSNSESDQFSFQPVKIMYLCEDIKCFCYVRKNIKINDGTVMHKYMYKCIHCAYAAMHEKLIRSHISIHNEQKRFKCLNCNYSSRYEESLRVHLRNHTRPTKELNKHEHYQYSSGNKNYFKNHPRIQSEKKLYRCLHCKHIYRHKYELMKHLLIHGDKNSYHCSLCLYATDEKVNFMKHILVHCNKE